MASKDGKIISTAQLVNAVHHVSKLQAFHEQTSVKKIGFALHHNGRMSINASDAEIKEALDWLKKQNMLSIP